MVFGAAPPSFSEPEIGPFRVSLVLWRGCEAACMGFLSFIEQRELPIEITQYDAMQDAGALAEIAETLNADRPDLLVTWGTSVSLELLGRHDLEGALIDKLGVPGVFMIVSQPIESGLVPDYTSSGRQITGIRYLLPEETQMQVARSYFDFQRLGVLFNSNERNSVLSVNKLEALQSELDFSLNALPVPLDEDGRPDPDEIPALVERLAREGVEAIYQGPDSFMNENSDLLSDAALSRNLPIFSAGEGPVRDSGALLGVTNSYYVVGQMAAQITEQILIQDTAPESIPIALPQKYSVVINMDTARALGLYPPMILLRVSELVERSTGD